MLGMDELFDPTEDPLVAGGGMDRDDLFPPRTDRERAKEYLRGRAPRPKAPPQTEGLFPEPEHQTRRWVPLRPDPDDLFPDLQRKERALIPVDGWPDYRPRGGDA